MKRWRYSVKWSNLRRMDETSDNSRPWTFLSNYAHVLVCLAEDPTARMRDVGDRVGITERAAIRIVKHLEEADVLTKERNGRRNRYQINMGKALRHPIESNGTVGALLRLSLGSRQIRRASR